MTRFCKDCKWCEPTERGLLSWQCKAPAIPLTANLIDGSPKPLVSFCDVSRESPIYCGPDARWFEPRTEQAAA